MSPLDILIADDEPLARNRLQRLLLEAEVVKNTQINFNIHQAENGQQVLDKMDDGINLVFLDVEMPGMTGLEAAKYIAQEYPYTPMVFITAFDQYALDAFELFASGFLVKPVNRQKLNQLLEKLLPVIKQNAIEETFLASKVGHTIEKVPLNDIQYVLAKNKYAEAYHNNKVSLLDVSLKHLEQEYPQKFLRIHRNTLVDPKLIERISREGNQSFVHLTGTDNALEISRRHIKDVKDCLTHD